MPPTVDVDAVACFLTCPEYQLGWPGQTERGAAQESVSITDAAANSLIAFISRPVELAAIVAGTSVIKDSLIAGAAAAVSGIGSSITQNLQRGSRPICHGTEPSIIVEAAGARIILHGDAVARDRRHGAGAASMRPGRRLVVSGIGFIGCAFLHRLPVRRHQAPAV